MKIRKEVQIGLTVIIAAICLYSGILYLKTSNFFYNDRIVYALYWNTDGLTPSTTIFAKGYNIGKIKLIDAADNMLSRFCLHISFNRDIKIPKNSYFKVKNQLIGGNDIILELGDDTTHFFNFGDTIPMISGSAIGKWDRDSTHRSEELSTSQTFGKINTLVDSFAVFLGHINYLITDAIQPHLKNILNNTAQVTEHLSRITNNLSGIDKSLMASIKNMEKFTENLNHNTHKLNAIIQNTQSFTEALRSFDVKHIQHNVQNTTETLEKAAQSIKTVTDKINKTEGSLGLLIHDKKLYENLNESSNNLKILLKDIKENPRRYIHIQVFGGGRDKKKKATASKSDSASTLPKVSSPSL